MSDDSGAEGAPVAAVGDREPAADAQAARIVVLVSIDTLRADFLGAYGYGRFTSPVIDMLASEGVLFEDASATSPWTLPSHASMLTGLTPVSHGVVSMKTALDPELPTLARRLAEAGFETRAVVNSTWLKAESYGVTRDFGRVVYIPDVADRRTPSTWVTDQAIEWIREGAGQRLFLFVHYYDVHADYASEPAYEALFTGPYEGVADGSGWQLTRANLPDAYLEMCRTAFDERKCRFGSAESPWVVDETVEGLDFDAADLRHLEDLYAAGVRQMDAELGRLVAWLRSEELLDETLFVVTSDHGEEFGEHGRVDHFLPVWQEVLRVPLVFRGPGVAKGRRVSAPVSIVDVAPTLLAMTTGEVDPDLDGRDLGPLLRGEPAAGFEDRLLYGEAAGGLSYDLVARGYFPVFRSVRRGRFKLVHDSLADAYALFDLETDPAEQHDVSPHHEAVARELREALERRATGADGEVKDPVVLSDEEIERLRSLGYLQ